MQKKTGKQVAAVSKPASGSAPRSKAQKRIYATRRLVEPDTGSNPSSRRVLPPRALIQQLTEIEESGGSGQLELGPDITIGLTNLGKIFFPKKKLTKGDLMRYYVTVAPFVLPVMADRPLVLKRFPNGVNGEAFFQQNASKTTPEGVRTATIETRGGSTNRRIVGGDLLTLIYTVQLGAISVDPWHSRLQSLDHADYSILDLDPGPHATFRRVVEVARHVCDLMDGLGLHGALKTSGSSGLHIYLPLPGDTPNEAATLTAQIIATRVAEGHPKVATVERSVKARSATAVYVDYLQNIIGKTVAGAYSARANPDAIVSTPLLWNELDDDLDPRAFTIETAPSRVAEVGDVWAAQMKKRNSLRALV